jgi:menaquinone-dependent protoporphyrinogen oxidase
MTMRILVTAASKHEATAQIADTIAHVLEGSGHEATVLDPGTVTSLDGYDAVVLGSAVYAGRWLDSAKQLVERFEAELKARPTWLFSSGPLGDPPQPAGEPPDGTAMSSRLAARDHRVFPGRLDRKRLSFLERTMVGAVKAPDGDFRPWDEIRAWAVSIGVALREEAASPVG